MCMDPINSRRANLEFLTRKLGLRMNNGLADRPKLEVRQNKPKWIPVWIPITHIINRKVSGRNSKSCLVKKNKVYSKTRLPIVPKFTNIIPVILFKHPNFYKKFCLK